MIKYDWGGLSKLNWPYHLELLAPLLFKPNKLYPLNRVHSSLANSNGLDYLGYKLTLLLLSGSYRSIYGISKRRMVKAVLWRFMQTWKLQTRLAPLTHISKVDNGVIIFLNLHAA